MSQIMLVMSQVLFTCLALVMFHPQAANAAQETVWGGDHVELHMTANGAELEFDCAVGQINEPLKPDAQGKFQARGTFSPEHAGPVRRDEGNATTSVTYAGSIDGNSMTLYITREGQDRAMAQYTLNRGQSGNLRKCR